MSTLKACQGPPLAYASLSSASPAVPGASQRLSVQKPIPEIPRPEQVTDASSPASVMSFIADLLDTSVADPRVVLLTPPRASPGPNKDAATPQLADGMNGLGLLDAFSKPTNGGRRAEGVRGEGKERKTRESEDRPRYTHLSHDAGLVRLRGSSNCYSRT
ncbi:hypothetical protein NUW54_g12961 [Trametes sanguinea]|uniref:Uncharacterized protein n=1 Tax=Trametes sanguinea TaxID=158606 RepID=A0ACC1MS59_9APHY|nr:hypothetical protein NUW54_g12961 [Trametes sanguinea]